MDDDAIRVAARATEGLLGQWVNAALDLEGLAYPDPQYTRRLYLSALGRAPTHTEQLQATQMARDLSGCGLAWEEQARVLRVNFPLLGVFYGIRCNIGAQQVITADRAFAQQQGAWVDAVNWSQGRELPGAAAGLIIGDNTAKFSRGGPSFQHMLTGLVRDGAWYHSLDGGQPGILLRSRRLVQVWTGNSRGERTGELWLANVPRGAPGAPLTSDGRPQVGRRVIGWIDPLRLPYLAQNEPAPTLPPPPAELPDGPPLDTTLGLQRALIRVGFDPGRPDGIDGPKTRAAVRAFQASRPPLDVDGIAGPKTRAVLAHLLAALSGGP